MNRPVYSGSFDPITKGHLEIIKKSVELFGGIDILVANNTDKNHMFGINERVEFANRCCEKLEKEMMVLHSTIKVYSCEYLYDWITSHHPSFVVRGLRNEGDFRYETTLDLYTSDLDVDTIYLTPRKYRDASSTLVRYHLKTTKNPDAILKYVDFCILDDVLRLNK